jgi:hypothetical protein
LKIEIFFILKFNFFFFFFAGTKLIQEKNSERIAAQKEHQKTIDNLRKEHKKELEVQLGHSAS